MRLLPALFTAAYLVLVACAARNGRQPGAVVAVALLGGGVLAPVVARLLAGVFGGWESWPSFVSVWPTAPVIWLVLAEEAGKAVAVLAAYAGLRRQYHTGLDGALYGLGVGAGYALMGLVASLLQGSPLEPGVGLHVLGAGLAQAMAPALFGALLGFGREGRLRGPLRRGVPAVGWMAGAAGSVAFLQLARVYQVPGPWRLLAAAGLLLWEWAPIGLLALVHVWARRQERELLLLFLREEVAADVVTEDEFLALLVDDRGLPKPLRQAVVRLVSAKWKLARGLGREDEVEAWRDRVRRLRRAG